MENSEICTKHIHAVSKTLQTVIVMTFQLESLINYKVDSPSEKQHLLKRFVTFCIGNFQIWHLGNKVCSLSNEKLTWAMCKMAVCSNCVQKKNKWRQKDKTPWE